MASVLLIGRDNDVTYGQMILSADGSYINNAVLSAQLLYENETPVLVSGSPIVVTLTNTSVDGNYRGLLAYTLVPASVIDDGGIYLLKFTASNYLGFVDYLYVTASRIPLSQ